MSDSSAVEALLARHKEGNKEPLLDDEGRELSAQDIMARIHDIGTKITAVSTSTLYLYSAAP